jgi:hypothetical protein
VQQGVETVIAHEHDIECEHVWIDRFLNRKRLFADRLERLAISQEQAFWIMRGAASIVFGALFVYGLTGDPFLLTPELRTPSTMLKWLHLVMALAVLYRPTVPLTGVGIFVLYGLGIADYGRFHMLDYLMFLGIGVYFLLAPFRGENWIKLRYITLFATTGLSLLWGALEKLAYPQWTYPLLAEPRTADGHVARVLHDPCSVDHLPDLARRLAQVVRHEPLDVRVSRVRQDDRQRDERDHRRQ